jgi:hypothetical protein
MMLRKGDIGAIAEARRCQSTVTTRDFELSTWLPVGPHGVRTADGSFIR